MSLHNLLASGYQGAVFGTNLQGEEVLGIQTVADVADLPDGEIDLVFVCTPASANPALLRACAAKGVRAAFLTSAGYGEAGDEGRRAEAELVALADELGILLAGPNGQGVVSTPVGLCAQIVAPYPPAGRIGVASQSGNFVSSFLNFARATGVGISRAVSAGNAAAVSVADYLDHYADDAGDRRRARLRRGHHRRPRRCSTASPGPPRASRSCSSRAGRPRAAPGPRRATPVPWPPTTRSSTASAAPPASPGPPPSRRRSRRRPRSPRSRRRPGPNVVVLTTAGGWGVVTADAIARDGDLRLLALPDDLRDAIDALLPPRWSRNNPVDCAGGETRDTIPEVMRLIAEHPDVARHRLPRHRHPVQPGPDDARRPVLPRLTASTASSPTTSARTPASPRPPTSSAERTGKPILTATELAVADPANAGPATVRATGRLCYPSGNRAVTALGHLYRDARHRSATRRVMTAGARPSARSSSSPSSRWSRRCCCSSCWRWADGRAEGADPPPSTRRRAAGAVAGADDAAAVVPARAGGRSPATSASRRSGPRSPRSAPRSPSRRASPSPSTVSTSGRRGPTCR